MSSRNTCQRVTFTKAKKQWPMPCVYCHDDEGAFLKNGKVEYGRHHVKDCLKTKKHKPSRGRNKSSLKKEVAEDGSVWNVKVSRKKKNRVSNDAMKVLKSAKNTLGLLCAMDDKIVKEDANNEKFLKAEEAKTIPSISTPKVAMGGWLAVAKAKKPMSKKETKIEIPIVDSKSKTTSPKRVFVLKKESMMGYTPTPFKKGSVMSFSDIQEKFSNTDCWGDSDDDC